MGCGNTKNLKSTVTLNDGVVMPMFGLGTYEIEDDQSGVEAVLHALKHGYRLLDTAEFYKNEVSVGLGMKKSGLKRQDMFVVTKLLEHGSDVAKENFHESLKKLDSGYVDLYLMHHPMQGKVLETYDAMLELKKEGLIRSVGVSNFYIHHLEALKAAGRPLPSVNQIQLNPFKRHKELVDYCCKEGITVMGYCPLARMQRDKDDYLVQLANKYGKSVPQIMIRWSVQSDFITIPKSTNKQRIEQNADVFNFRLTPAEMEKLEENEEFSCLSFFDSCSTDPWIG